ncbi:hypothetical protein PG996_001949 [Apiospora saccharicola]|uniref:Pt repeat family protein n=1 Tax=Apiospora saccharicola TaxID=335842 RepID=A0ABR1WI86_9PEZI
MAWDAPKGRPKVFQSRLKTFVKTLRGSDSRKSGGALTASGKTSTLHSRDALDATEATDYFQSSLKPSQSQPELATTALELVEPATPAPELLDLATPAPEEPSEETDLLSKCASTEASLREPQGWEADEDQWAISGPIAPQNDDEKPGLSVPHTPLRVTENLCQGLLRRIDHSCYELITRKDPNASAATQGRGQTKPKRFELTTQISQCGELWATRTYTSYQKTPVTAEAAKDIILSSNRMIGLFLKRHDPDFIWRVGPLYDDLHPLPELRPSPYRIGSIQPFNCIPRSEFIEKSQAFETTPGYKLDLAFTFLNRQGEVPWQKAVQVASNQTTPLTLAVAETLFSDASYALEGAVRSRRRHVQEEHAKCRFDGGTCQHYLEEASEIALKVTNNFGPDFNHLARSIQSKLVLFEDGNSPDCREFVDSLQKAIAESRDTADLAIIETNDLDLKIVELRGSGWSLEEPLVFTLPAATSYSRRSIEAILDRVQTGISAVLRGNAATVRYIAWKRGHLILDKTLVAREPKSATRRLGSSSATRTKVVNKLRRRVEQDIEMICKDTCSLPEAEADPSSDTDEPAQRLVVEGFAFVAQTAVADDEEEPSLPYIPSMGPRLAQSAYSTVSGTDVDSSVVSQVPVSPKRASEEERERPTTSARSITSMNSQSSKMYRDPKTGHRAFPLVPSASTFGVLELLKQPDSQTEEKELSMPGTTFPTQLPIEDVLQGSKSQHASTADSGSMSRQPNTHDGTIAGDHQDQDQERESAARVTEPEDTGVHEAGLERARSVVSSQYSASDEKLRHGGTGYQASTVPSTPSLVSGHSPRSSLIVTTPQMSGSMSSAELQFLMAGHNAEGYVIEEAEFGSESSEAEIQHKSIKSTPEDPSPVRFVRPRQRPSPLQRDLFMPEASNSGEPRSGDEGAEGEGEGAAGAVPAYNSPHPSEEGPNSTSSDVAQPDEANGHGSLENRKSNATLVPSPDNALYAPSSNKVTLDLYLDPPPSQAAITSNHGLNPPKTPSDAGFNLELGDDFAQTREEIDFSASSAFSSPWSTSTAQGGDYTTLPPRERRYTNLDGELYDVFADDNEHAIVEDNQSSCMGLSAPSSPALSAGLLGLADSQHMIGVGLRRALAMNHPPRRKGSIPLALRTVDFFHTQPRRMSMGRELQILKRPSLRAADISQRPASSGRELEMRYLQEGAAFRRHRHDDDGDGKNTEKPKADPEATMQRSFSSNVLQDFHVREVAKKDEKKKISQDGTEDEEGDEQWPGTPRPRSSSLMFLLAGATLASRAIAKN